MFPALNVRFSVLAFPVAYRQSHNLKVVSGCSKQEIEIAKGIDLAKVSTIGCDGLIVGTAENLRAAKAVLHALTQQPGECKAEELVPEQVEKTHRLLLHRIDQPH